MGALTIPMYFRETQVVSGDVIHLRPRGLRRLFARPILGIVDLRDRSVPYLAYVRRGRVLKVPLDGLPFSAGAYLGTVYRLPGIDKARASVIAARAAERPGEQVHHPTYDCGRALATGQELVVDAYRAIDVDVALVGDAPGPPLAPVVGPQDPPNEVTASEVPGTEPSIARDGARSLVERGIEKTLPWQRRSRR